MYALGINLAQDASACLIGESGASFCAHVHAPLCRPEACMPDPAGRWFTQIPVSCVAASLDAAGIDYNDLDIVTFSNGVVWSPTEIRNLTVADCAVQLPWSMQSRMATIGAHLADAYAAWCASQFHDATVLVLNPNGSIATWQRCGGSTGLPLVERATIYRTDPDGLELTAWIGEPAAGSIDRTCAVAPAASRAMTAATVMPLARYAVDSTGCRRLCIVAELAAPAGVAPRLGDELGVELFVHPPGRYAALGAAAHGWHCVLGQPLPRSVAARACEVRAC